MAESPKTDRVADLSAALARRFTDAPDVPSEYAEDPTLRGMAARGSCRAFTAEPVPESLLEMLAAVSLSAPTKSDLQQRDIVFLRAPELRARIAKLTSGQSWIAGAPMIAIFCGNNRRVRQIHEWTGIPFANDHLDAFFNAACDAAIALGAFVTAAEAVGLGCCPISAVRNEAAAVSDILGLPQHVFPFAGLAIGTPAKRPDIAPRLPLAATCHWDKFSEEGLQDQVSNYDAHRRSVQPYATQRFTETFGQSDSYGWSEDKARQYSEPERDSFGTFVRDRGFRLD